MFVNRKIRNIELFSFPVGGISESRLLIPAVAVYPTEPIKGSENSVAFNFFVRSRAIYCPFFSIGEISESRLLFPLIRMLGGPENQPHTVDVVSNRAESLQSPAYRRCVFP